ncbi:enhancer of split m4 protein-like [Musca vetustissima]|uniref:enhancer of split m4 protein-like n=1 Tax=Musca vetustissima TaxID=27455 RepID=UPI002AB74D4D|nr:enhancer of split m4 protein-like [Musca vetustissima]
MCVEMKQTQQYNKMDITVTSNKKSYSVKKLLKQIFKQQKSTKIAADSMESLESLENSRNASLESDCASMESFENDINEKLSAKLCCEEEELEYPPTSSVPVHFIRTEQGTFFWTTNNAFEQLSCQQDRWAQA